MKVDVCNVPLLIGLLIACEAAVVAVHLSMTAQARVATVFQVGPPLLMVAALGAAMLATGLAGAANAALRPCLGVGCAAFATALERSLLALVFSLAVLTAGIGIAVASSSFPGAVKVASVALVVGTTATSLAVALAANAGGRPSTSEHSKRRLTWSGAFSLRLL